jgi:hypothetical protein
VILVGVVLRIQQSAYDPDRLALADLREDDSTRHALMTTSVEQAKPTGCADWQLTPCEIATKLPARGETEVPAPDDIPRETPAGKVRERATLVEQAVLVQLHSGREHRGRGRIPSALRASSFGYRNEATTNHAHIANRMAVEAGRRFAEAQVLQLAHEVDYVTARSTSVTHKLARSGVSSQVGSPAIGVEWTPAREGGTGAAELDAILTDQFDDGVQLTQQICVDPSWGLRGVRPR